MNLLSAPIRRGDFERARPWVFGLAVLVAAAAGALSFTGVAQSTREATSQFVAIDLGTVGGPNSWAVAINDAGQVVGYSDGADGQTHAFTWTQAGGMVDLGVGQAVAVNAGGQVVGWRVNDSGYDRAFSWTQAGGMVDLGTLEGMTESRASALNDAGQVVGGSFNETTQTSHAFIWTPAGGMVDLGTLGGANSGASAINASGQVVGGASRPIGWSHAFSWTSNGGMVDLGTIGDSFSYPVAVNDGGQVVGYTSTRAFSWTQAGGMVNLGTLNGDPVSQARGVNAAGQVVGLSGAGVGLPPFHAFLWTQADGMIDLGTLGGILSQANAISDSGQVVGLSDLALVPTPVHAFSWGQGGGMIDLGTLGGKNSRADAVNENGQAVGRSQTTTGEWHATLWRPVAVDTSPPVLTVSDVIANATTPNGASVSYTVTATDETDPEPVVDCSPPTGSLFPIGRTTVLCTATDASGNTANAHFTVHVKGAAEQLVDLIALVDREHIGPGTSLHVKLVSALGKLHDGDNAGACSILDSFLASVRAQTGKSITPDQATTLTSYAQHIRDVIGC